MDNKLQFNQLELHQKISFASNVLILVGSASLGLAGLLKMISSGNLSEQAFQGGGFAFGNNNKVRSYFD